MDKKQSRRTFVRTGMKAGLAIPFLGASLQSCNVTSENQNTDTKENSKKLNILILGGTSFLGPHQIAYAIRRGHSITTFTRGKTKPTIHQALFDQVEQLIGDREDDLTALENREWDAVIDNSGRRVEWTESSAALLKEKCDLYLYTSSTGVYYPYVKSDYSETAEVFHVVPETTDEEEQLEYDYGVMKANSELAAMKQFGAKRTIVVRPTYMIGPADKTNRFIHWPIKLSQGGETMLPGKENDLVQYVDVRDVAEWMIRLIEEKKTGTFNAVGPENPQTMYEFAEEAAKAFDAETSFVKIDDYEFLKAQEVSYIVPWIMPTGNNEGSAKIANNKAKANGLSFRPIAESLKDTYNWWYSDAISQEQRDAVERNKYSVLGREADIIDAWEAL